MSEERGGVSQENKEQPSSSEGEQVQIGLSIILPIYEEEESIPTLIKELHRALSPLGRCYELICIDDGSGDQSYRVLSELAASDSALHLIQLRRNFGQTAAMQAGLDAARGALVSAGAERASQCEHRARAPDPRAARGGRAGELRLRGRIR